jgi:ABC-2 type transport system ATP-binding protein
MAHLVPETERGAGTGAAIFARGIRKVYGSVEAVRGVDLEVRHGEVFAFLGPNGAGKTTTVEMLEGYRAPDGGEIRVLGVEPARAPRAWRGRIGVVLQESEPEPELTARECLRLYAGYYPHPRSIDGTLALTGLEEQADRLARSLSGGQKRRLDVALGLIGDPELLFLDEPTTGFDPAARRAAWSVVAGLRDLGKTIFLTTHYMDEAEALADRIAVIARGAIVAEGTPSNLGGRDRAATRISFAPAPGMDIRALPGALASAAGLDGRGRVVIRVDDSTAALYALTSWALEHATRLEDLDVRRPTLEDIYLDLIAEAT